eukprot:gene27146-35870_t
MHGYEGTDVYEVIQNSKTKKCYIYTGIEKDGFFYPLHVAAEAGHKELVLMLVKAGAEVNLTDDRGNTAEEKCNGVAQHAFYELNGLRFEASERYIGSTNRQGERNGQGAVYFKSEGYLEKEKLLYKGSFKNNFFHGHGTLYWPGTEILQYSGRFKRGFKNGRGIEFDTGGKKVYHGTFRENVREGRGEEFVDDIRTYKGEFSNNKKHGFGVADYGEGRKYFGRFEDDCMSGVGIYCQPHGDRYEGFFINNKFDGQGSYYERDAISGKVTATHGSWQGGRKSSASAVSAGPFAPTLADLPDISNQKLFAELAGRSGIVGSDNVNEGSTSLQREDTVPTNFQHLEVGKYGLTKADSWKIQLGKYLKLNLNDAKTMGLNLVVQSTAPPKKKDTISDDASSDGALFAPESGDGMETVRSDTVATEDGDEGYEKGCMDEEEELDEVNGYHFVNCTTLFVAYIYVNSASKVFEERALNYSSITEQSDFEAVYHAVIDSVDNFNEKWEDAMKIRQQVMADEQFKSASDSLSKSTSPTTKQINPNFAVKRTVFMTEREKKDAMVLRQRAELHVKQGIYELAPAVEREIESEILNTLQLELSKLLEDEGDSNDHGNSQSNKSATFSPNVMATIEDLIGNNKFDGTVFKVLS